jgi:hypothetical protein
MIKVAGRGGGIIAVQNKRHYHKPVITCYGTVRTLTASGTGSDHETNTSANNNPCTADIHKKPCLSDRRTKENIVRVGSHSLGIGLYLFDYKPAYRQTWGHRRQFGVMADEVERVLPEAASVHADGYKMVDYAMLGISRTLE